jgi:hypothetical protein
LIQEHFTNQNGRTENANKYLEVECSTTTSKLDGKYKKVRSRDKGAMENNKRTENMFSQFHTLICVTQKTGWTAGTPIPSTSEIV